MVYGLYEVKLDYSLPYSTLVLELNRSKRELKV